jgi:Co/Zn/Cd efflux system component
MAHAATYELLGGDRHRHGRVEHAHPHRGPHTHEHGAHGHSHGLIDPSIQRSREGVRAVLLALLVLGLAAVAQLVVYIASGSVALLADLIHNAGDAATAIPLGIAFMLRSRRAERWAGLAVVAAIFASACVVGFEAIDRLTNPQDVHHLAALVAAGAIGFAGNMLAALIRTRAGRRLDSASLIADGAHARTDAYVSLAVIASAAVVAAGVPIADPLIGLAITLVILRITWNPGRPSATADTITNTTTRPLCPTGSPDRRALAPIRARVMVQLVGELADALRDVVAGGADRLERLALGVGELPVEVALAGDVGTGIAAAHRHDHVGVLGQLARQALGRAVGQVDFQLAHDLDDLGMDALGRRRAGAQRTVPTRGGLLEQRGAHLRATRVVQADEQHRRHQADSSIVAGRPCSPRTS